MQVSWKCFYGENVTGNFVKNFKKSFVKLYLTTFFSLYLGHEYANCFLVSLSVANLLICT